MNETIEAIAAAGRYRLRREDTRTLDTLRLMPCRRGGPEAHMYEHGPGVLAFTGSARGMRARLLDLDGVRPHQTGDLEFTVVFQAERFPEVAAIVVPRRKRPPGSIEALQRSRGTRPQVSEDDPGATIDTEDEDEDAP